jgi:hypothetical protein
VWGCGGILSPWEEKCGTVVLMGVLVMRFVDVKDPGETLFDTQRRLVYVFSIYEWKCTTSLRGSHRGVNILTML